MLLAIDIGNTNIRLGVFDKFRLLSSYDISTREKAYTAVLKRALKRFKVDRVVICSVVPAALKKLIGELKKIPGKRSVSIIGKEISVPLRNRYRRPKQVGQDRLVNAFAGVNLYGSPLIVIDSGTAVTFDVVTRRSEYLGGLILPGLELSLDTLYRSTALLPKLKLAPPPELIGRDTRNSILSGIVHGFAAAIDELVIRIKKEIGDNAIVVGTGGGTGLIRRYCRNTYKIDKDLTLKGINLLGRDGKGCRRYTICR